MRYEHVAFEVFLAVPRRLTPNNIMRDGCVQSNLPNPCAADICYHKNYRTFDGSCNNLRDSLKVIIAISCFVIIVICECANCTKTHSTNCIPSFLRFSKFMRRSAIKATSVLHYLISSSPIVITY
ncbi:unnamed protein product [Anisakis simplex]|uniref:Late nodulin n=1 Tax=Anisakis simplex TaxID=6269 RepID=A0A0M3J889_ANISI|nr:unnamed protein product [Anisakis simplex]